MIPYFYVDKISLGPLIVQVWGLFVALGIISGTLVSIKRAKRFNVKKEVIVDLIFWLTLTAFLGGRAIFVLVNKGFSLQGLEGSGRGFSSLGAVIGGIIVAFFINRKHRVTSTDILKIFGPALLLTEGIGRIGCFFIHEHLGRVAPFFWAVRVGDIARHDLGLYFSLSALIGFAIIAGLEKFRKTPISSVGWLSLSWYFTSRFLLEFLYEDGGQFGVEKYAGLSLMQIISILFFVIVVTLMTLRATPKVYFRGSS